jgi:hypothetical protein
MHPYPLRVPKVNSTRLSKQYKVACISSLYVVASKFHRSEKFIPGFNSSSLARSLLLFPKQV